MTSRRTFINRFPRMAGFGSGISSGLGRIGQGIGARLGRMRNAMTRRNINTRASVVSPVISDIHVPFSRVRSNNSNLLHYNSFDKNAFFPKFVRNLQNIPDNPYDFVKFIKLHTDRNTQTDPNWIDTYLPIGIMEDRQYDTENFLHFLHEEETMSADKIKWKFFLKQFSEISGEMVHHYLTHKQMQDILIFCFLWMNDTKSTFQKSSSIAEETRYIKQIKDNLSPYSGVPNEKFQRVLNKIAQTLSAGKKSVNRSGARSKRNTKRYNEPENTSLGSKSYTTSRANRSRVNTSKSNNKSGQYNQSKIEEEREEHIDFITSSFDINDTSPMSQTERLINIFNSDIDNILLELKSGRKKGHWAWWIFPTNHVGSSDRIKTRVTKDTTNAFLNSINLEKWKDSIKEVIKILGSDERRTLNNDIGRIQEFCLFWNNDNNVKHLHGSKLNWIPEYCAQLMDAIYNT